MKIIETIKKRIYASPLYTDEKYAKYRLLLVPFIVLISAILISVLVTVPQILNLINTFRTINELNQKKIFYQEKAAGLAVVNVPEVRSDLDTALVALPVDKDIPGVMGEILVTLGRSGMRLNGINFSNSPEESEKVQEYTITIEASGTETSLRNFLENVSLTPRLIKLSAITVDSLTGGNINAKISFATFYQTLPKVIGSVDEKLPVIGQNETQILADIEEKKRQFPSQTQESTGSAQGKANPFSR